MNDRIFDVLFVLMIAAVAVLLTTVVILAFQ